MPDLTFDDLVPAGAATATPGGELKFDDLVPVSTTEDVIRGGTTGVIKGAAEMAMLPVTATEALNGGSGWLANGAENLVRSAFGADPLTPDQRAKGQSNRVFESGEGLVRSLLGMDPVSAETEAERKAAREAMDGMGTNVPRQMLDDNLYKPTTALGKMAETGGTFLVPGGIPSRATRAVPGLIPKILGYGDDLLKNAVAPAVVSEGAGQAAEAISGEENGTAELVSRILGAFGGNWAASAARANNTAAAVTRRAVGDPNAVDWDRARAVQQSPTGIRPTSMEAVTQAQDGGTSLPFVQRLVEGSNEGRTATAPFFAQRPGQTDRAVEGVLDTITPAPANPSNVGPVASNAGRDAVRTVERQRTAAVDPHYNAAALDNVPPDQVQGVIAQLDAAIAADTTGILAPQLQEIRRELITSPAVPGRAAVPATRTPVMGPNGQVIRYTETPGTPAVDPIPEQFATDIGTLDRVRKYHRDRLALPQIGQDAITGEQSAAVNNILQRLDGVMEANSPALVEGKRVYGEMSDTLVNPVSNGPAGRVAAAGDTRGASEALLPRNPLANSQGETADATRRMMVEDPQATKDLVRQAIADDYAGANVQTQTGNREFAGAKFQKDVAGSPQREANLRAVLQESGGAPTVAAADALLEALGATSRRLPQGSPTASLMAQGQDMSSLGMLGTLAAALRSGGGSIFQGGKDALQRNAMRGTIDEFADIMVDPQGVDRLLALALKGRQSPLPDAIARTATQVPAIQSNGY